MCNYIKALLFILFFSFIITPVFSQVDFRVNDSLKGDFSSSVKFKTVITSNDTLLLPYVNTDALYKEGWDKLAQPMFWKKIMSLSPDSCYINIAGKRVILDKRAYQPYLALPKTYRDSIKRTINLSLGLDTFTPLFVTSGKKEFYEHRKTIPEIGLAVKAFMDNGVDPWYAQTILLIESPGKAATRSSVGARGPFQLMSAVGKRFGLKVNKNIDERTDLYKAAGAASKLISIDCIPRIKNLLTSWNIPFKETDVFFRLLVLHAYHAGPGNVKCAVDAIAPTEGGISLISKLWQTECGGFRNESQNYSQIALASILLFNEINAEFNDTVFMVLGDHYYNACKSKNPKAPLSIQQLNKSLDLYDKDLVDGTINLDYYLAKSNKVKHELGINSAKNKQMQPEYPNNENHYLDVGNDLMSKNKITEAITVLKFNIERFPDSSLTADSLSRAYSKIGNVALSQKYAELAKKNAQ
ncbi:MAG: transglycosylase SLT domain-containing protein [Bacteroidia bacterium]|nr:transglycosylase SLT domain-containing protein [Bacteroidia bacterium]